MGLIHKKHAIIALCLAIAIIFSACACSGAKPSDNDGADDGAKEYVNALNLTADSRLFEIDEAVYCLSGDAQSGEVLYFSDKEYKCWMPLCSKPDCSHRTQDCNARFEGQLLGGVWLWGQNIYYTIADTADVVHPQLWRMELDGSKHQIVLKFDLTPKEGRLPSESSDCFFHDRYAVLSYTGTDAEVTKQYHWIADLSVDPPELKELVLQDERGEAYPYFLNPVLGKDDMLILSHLDKELYIVDLAGGTIKHLCELPFYLSRKHCTISGNDLILCDGFNEGLIASVDVETGTLTTVNCAEPQTKQWYYPYKQYIFGSNGSTVPSLWQTEIYDLNGELIVHIPHEDYKDKSLWIVTMVGDYVFGYEPRNGILNTGDLPLWYLDICDIGTDKLAWRRWEP